MAWINSNSRWRNKKCEGEKKYENTMTTETGRKIKIGDILGKRKEITLIAKASGCGEGIEKVFDAIMRDVDSVDRYSFDTTYEQIGYLAQFIKGMFNGVTIDAMKGLWQETRLYYADLKKNNPTVYRKRWTREKKTYYHWRESTEIPMEVAERLTPLTTDMYVAFGNVVFAKRHGLKPLREHGDVGRRGWGNIYIIIGKTKIKFAMEGREWE